MGCFVGPPVAQGYLPHASHLEQFRCKVNYRITSVFQVTENEGDRGVWVVRVSGCLPWSSCSAPPLPLMLSLVAQMLSKVRHQRPRVAPRWVGMVLLSSRSRIGFKQI